MFAPRPTPVLAALAALGLATPATAAAAPRATTLDRDGDGRVDRVEVVLPGAARAAAVRVDGFRVLRVRRAGRRIVALVRPHARPDGGVRPRIRVRARRRTWTVRARDGVRPRILGARVAGARLLVTFSEPVAAARPGLTVHEDGGRRRLAAVAPGRTTALAVGARPPLAVAVRSGAVRDRAGNPARAQARRVAAPAAARTPVPRPAPARTPSPPPSPANPAPSNPPPAARPPDAPWHVLRDPIDPRQQTALAFGDRSHWLQPWRGYLDTPPVSALRDATGINFNVPVGAADVAARLLARAGFRRARLELGWSELAYDDPSALADPAAFRTRLLALKSNGIRPLILLNANDSIPTPVRRTTLRVLAPAAAGARTVRLDPASAAQVVPGRTGFSDVSRGRAAEVLVSAVAPDGTATLAKPLPAPVPAGDRPAATLRYEPFGAPRLADGSPSPRFEATLAGWLRYVETVTTAARTILGGEDFDVEVWNEMNFGSDFLDAANYHAPVPAGLAGSGSVTDTLLRRTVAWLRDPAHGVSRIGITDGFASQTPWVSGATAVLGLSAMSKHPYYGRRTFGGVDAGPNRPLDATGAVDGLDLGGGNWLSRWSPSYTSYFPEYYLTGLQTETLVRDLSPITTSVGSVPHGRSTAPAGGAAPQVWITETNINASEARLPAADRWHMLAKTTLRTFASYVNKGVSALYLYAVNGTDYGLADLDAVVRSGGTSGGAVFDAMGRMYDRLGTGTITRRRGLSLRSIADQADRVQFRGDGTAAHPDLHDRDVVGAFPYQVSDRRFVVPAYVMTRDVARLYDPAAPATDPTRYDLPAEAYRLELGGVDGARAQVSAYDPLSDRTVPATVVARTADSVTVQLALTDSPRLLQIDD